MSKFWQTAVNNPRTSLSGIFSFLMLTGGYIAGYAKIHNWTGHWAVLGSICAFVAGLAKLYVRFIAIDPGKVEAILPDSPKPQMVPSTEVPIDPKAEVLVKGK